MTDIALDEVPMASSSTTRSNCASTGLDATEEAGSGGSKDGTEAVTNAVTVLTAADEMSPVDDGEGVSVTVTTTVSTTVDVDVGVTEELVVGGWVTVTTAVLITVAVDTETETESDDEAITEEVESADKALDTEDDASLTLDTGAKLEADVDGTGELAAGDGAAPPPKNGVGTTV